MPPEIKPANDVAANTAAILNAPLALPCGVTLPNRLANGAMSEPLAVTRNRATTKHETLGLRGQRRGRTHSHESSLLVAAMVAITPSPCI
jgi:hypothetical protein